MALTQQDTLRTRLGNPSPPARARHQGRKHLAEIVPIHSAPTSQGKEKGGMVSRLAQVFASLRSRAASGGTPPRPPSPPAPLGTSLLHTAAPDDAA